MKVKIKKLSENAKLPVRINDNSHSYNLICAGITTEVNSCREVIVVYHSGLSLDIPDGYIGILSPRDNFAEKSLEMCDSVIILDSSCKEEIVARFRTTVPTIPAVINVGEPFAKLTIIPAMKSKVDWAEIKDESSAGEGDQSPLEKEGEPTNSEPNEPSGGEANIPEEA